MPVSQIVEYGAWSITGVTGAAQTTDSSSWAALVDVDNTLAAVYNKIPADYVAVTTKGKVTAFRVRDLHTGPASMIKFDNFE